MTNGVRNSDSGLRQAQNASGLNRVNWITIPLEMNGSQTSVRKKIQHRFASPFMICFSHCIIDVCVLKK